MFTAMDIAAIDMRDVCFAVTDLQILMHSLLYAGMWLTTTC